MMSSEAVHSTQLSTECFWAPMSAVFLQTDGLLASGYPVYSEEKCNSLWWQIGICGKCGISGDYAKVFIRFTMNNDISCGASLKIKTEPPFWVRHTPWMHFDGSSEYSIKLCSMEKASFSLHLVAEVTSKVVVRHPVVWNNSSDVTINFLKLDTALFDCSIQCGSVHFQAHKCVLAAHSPVLREALLSVETIESCMEMEPRVFSHFLHFLYHGLLSDTALDQDMDPLLQLAAVYQVRSLLQYLAAHMLHVWMADESDIKDFVEMVYEFWSQQCVEKDPMDTSEGQIDDD